MKRFLLKKTKFFKYSYFLHSRWGQLKKKKWNTYKFFNFRNYQERVLNRFYRSDVIKIPKKWMPKSKNFFNINLKNKQWVKHLYGGLSNKSFKSLFFKKRSVFFRLESRLDVKIFRTWLGFSILLIRHLISHKKVKVNNNIVTKPSLNLKKGDIISIFLKKKDVSKKFKGHRFISTCVEINCVRNVFVVLTCLNEGFLKFVSFKDLQIYKIYSFFVSHNKN